MPSDRTKTEAIVANETTLLYREIDALIASIRRESDAQVATWRSCINRADFEESAANLAHYMAFRRRDLRALQRSLMKLGLSSLGRLESRVLPTLVAVKATLAALAQSASEEGPSSEAFFSGERLLEKRTHDLLGASTSSRRRALLVTCPAEAADDPSFMLALAGRGIEAVRINCAHDSRDQWERMIRHARAAEKSTGHRFKILMDLGGPKIRTGEVRLPEGTEHVKKGALLAIVPSGALERVALRDEHCSIECTLPEALSAAQVGDRLYVDDGKLAAKVERKESWGLIARVTQAAAKGVRLKPEKGLNFPDTVLKIAALTDKDRTDLDFVAAHADGIGF